MGKGIKQSVHRFCWQNVNKEGKDNIFFLGVFFFCFDFAVFGGYFWVRVPSTTVGATYSKPVCVILLK